ncbi:hypothetical protein PoB_002882300 [Plakobranchus ocellatus]|uniref:Uncharacterized protein n=1 Tax=Plakobranchus ocellatus TaxID=259542 RepID=A0AAV4A533_9GAST|nr:hypothetical protein PoB_002882300 [Plakobranchus ocellatus]
MCSTSHCLCHSASSTWRTSFCGIMSEEITLVLKSIQEMLIKLKTRISVLETDKESESRPVQPNATEGGFATDSTWTRFRSTDDTVGPSDTVRSRAPLASVPPGSISPTEQFGAADIQHDFERIRDSLVRIPVPTGLKVSDSSVGIKQECRPALKILSKCARYGETGLKILSQIVDEPGETINVKKSDLDSIFVTLAAEVNFLQSEFAALVVKSTFNEDTSRIFRSFENNQGSFSETSLQNVRVAAELAAAQSRFSQSHSQYRGSRARGRNRGGGNYSFWSRPFRRDGQNDNTHRGHHGGGFPPTHRSTDEA